MFITDFLNKIKEHSEREKSERQSWRPRGLLRIISILCQAAIYAVKIAAAAAATVALIGVLCALVFADLMGSYLQEEIIPSAEGFALENYDLDQTSFIYAVDSSGDINLLQQIHTSTNRQWVSYEDIPTNLINAAVAIEDKRFFEHQGVDWITTVKACAGMFMGTSSAGGSTITQQLIKNLTQEDSVTVQRKVLEIFRAQLFERRYDKDVILEWYMNTIYLGQGCWGVKSAAATYFGKELEKLTLAECASLISITNNPSYFDPYNIDEDVGLDGRANNRKRQENVLWAMKEQGLISEQEYDQALAQEMVFKSGIADEDRMVYCENCGFHDIRSQFTADEAGLFYCPDCHQEVTVTSDNSQSVYSWFVDTVIEDVAQDLAAANHQEWNEDTKKIYKELIQRGGYHIYTTMDMEVQDQVDRIYTDLDIVPDTRSGQQLQSAIVVVDNSTGDIVAMSGGTGEKITHDAWNRATDSKLQTGSSMKPLTCYAPAFELGVINPSTVLLDLPLNYDSGSAFPLNDTRTYEYSRTIFTGIVKSVNTIAVGTLDTIGPQFSYDFAKYKFRLTTLTDSYISPYTGEEKNDIDLAPLGMGALTLGATVRDMSSAYATFANDGVWREGRTYTKVYDSDGNIVLDNKQESEQILSHKTVNYMNYCLYNVVTQGTGTEAAISGQSIYGKTGTTEGTKDRWFCGFSGYYTAAVWCGYDSPERVYVTESGVWNPSAYLWKRVMEPLHEGLARVSLYDNDMSSATVCLDSGLLATDACKLDVRTDLPRTSTASVYWEDRETETCDRHALVDYCTTGGGVANEYCMKFAELEEAKVEKKALVKWTQEEIDTARKAFDYNLDEKYLNDAIIWLVSENGQDLNFHGLKGDKNVGVNAPYVVCTQHTKAAWDALHAGEGDGELTPQPGIIETKPRG